MNYNITVFRDGMPTSKHIESSGDAILITYVALGLDVSITIDKTKVDIMTRPKGDNNPATWTRSHTPLQDGVEPPKLGRWPQ